jgi:ornithine cyclodeaminase/alanine dehydrogenase-like protein (mu-crystallin family)
MRILTASDIQRALPMAAAIETQKQAYAAVADRTAVLPLRTPLSVPEHNALTLFMPARVANDLGVKIVSVFPNNVRQGLPMIHGVVIMVETATGRPAALLDATYLTALRTGAGAGAATDVLARPESRAAALLGTGALARTHLLALCHVRPIDRVAVYSRDAGRVAAFINEMQAAVEARLMAAATPAEAVRDADVICCATTSSTPVFDGHDLKPGAHVNGVGSYTLQMQEVDIHTVLRAGVVFVDARESVLAEAGDVANPIQAGIIAESDLVEIGAVINGTHPGRRSAEAITFFKSCGVAAQDVTAAGEVLRRATELNLGTDVPL